MKEKVIIADKDISFVCENCIRNENCKDKDAYSQVRCCFNFGLIPANIEIEQSPNTYKELKQILLDKYSNNKDYKIDTRHGDIYLDNIKRKDSFTITITYDKKDKVSIFDGEWLVTYNRTPEQALKIIENMMD